VGRERDYRRRLRAARVKCLPWEALFVPRPTHCIAN
jgi:hypothetical protein